MSQSAVASRVDWRWYGWLVLLSTAAFQVSLPIAMLDSDMWYHLSDGRYFLEQGTWPYHTYFSFIEPPRELLNHWWLFQPVATLVFENFGYQGLVFLRAGLFVLACYLIYRLLLEADPRARANGVTFFVFALVIVILHYRGFQLRPYLMTYVSIGVFLYVLERKPAYVYVLPVLSILWANTHGVGWPIAAVICGAYFVEWAYERYRLQRHDPERGPGYALALVLCGFGFMVNPIGWNLFVEPFMIAPDASRFIGEMRPLSLRAMTQFIAEFGSFGNLSVVSIFTAMTVFATVNLVMRRRYRLSHLLLTIGGLLLLIRASRFLQVWMLLSLPMLRAFAEQYHWRLQWRWRPSTLAVLVVSAWVLVLPVYLFVTKIDPDRPYPFDWKTAPVGTVQFLDRQGTGGRILATPGHAGYLEWYLLPEGYRVYADMRMNRYSYKLMAAFRNLDALRQFDETYRPDFLMVPIGARNAYDRFEDLGGYVPVFLDDKVVLWAHEERQAALVDEFAFDGLDIRKPLAEIEDDRQREAALRTLERVVESYPEGFFPRFLLVKHLFDATRFEEAERHVDQLLVRFPRSVNALTFKGNILENTDRCPEALEYFDSALARAAKRHRRNLLKHVGTCHYLVKNHQAAYRAFHEALNPYVSVEEPAYLYQYAFTAAYNGHVARAIRILELLMLTSNDEESADIREKAEVFLDRLRGPEFGNPQQGTILGRLLGQE